MKNNSSKSMIPGHQSYYEAFKAHDARFDGRIFIGVSSTGIYCRPVCRVKTPKLENCSFHISAAAAEAAGFRPCLKCRPELAPGLAPVDAASRLARQAALLMQNNDYSENGLATLAQCLGVTSRHLRRVFAAEYGVSPIQYQQTRRLLLAKQLLADTRLSVTQVAYSAGFGSLRRFNELFKTRYRLNPTTFRRTKGIAAEKPDDGLTLRLDYRPPYQWDKMLNFLASRTITGVESVADGAYRRTVALADAEKTHRGWISVKGAGSTALALTVSPSLLPVLAKIMARVRHLFDLDCDPVLIGEKLSVMNDFKPGLCPKEACRVPGCFEPFEMAVRAIVGQQVTVKAARTLADRLAEKFGSPLETPFADLNRSFPEPTIINNLSGLIENNFGPLGIIATRARSIKILASAMVEGRLTLSPTANPEVEMKNLLDLPGFGPWTVQYLAMRALNWPDAFPHTDYGVKKALGLSSPAEILRLAEQWRPWRSYATIMLWNSL